jgi:hypothetical protein
MVQNGGYYAKINEFCHNHRPSVVKMLAKFIVRSGIWVIRS